MERISRHYSWKGMSADIENHVKKCKLCQRNKQVIPNKMPMALTDTSSFPIEKVYLKIIGPLNEKSMGNKYILTFMDDLSKLFDC